MNIHVKKQFLFVKWQKQIYIHFRCHIMFGCHKKKLISHFYFTETCSCMQISIQTKESKEFLLTFHINFLSDEECSILYFIKLFNLSFELIILNLCTKKYHFDNVKVYKSYHTIIKYNWWLLENKICHVLKE